MLRRLASSCLLLALVASCSPAFGAEPDKFQKLTLSAKFYSEGMYYGDFNKDGKTDVCAGPYWYAGPEFKQQHEFAPAKEFDPKGYSNAFLMFAHDFNQDGWDDILVIGFPGKEAFWYENPQAAGQGPWKQHLAHPVVDNESPGFGDLTGDGKPELVFHTGGQLGYAAPDWSNPTAPWKFTPVSKPGPWQKFTHGLGWGDVNGDGRQDLLLKEGWYEQPADANEPWRHHAVNFGAGGAQMHVYDVDGDGDGDVITSLQAHGYGLAWFEQKKDPQGAIAFEQHLIVGSKPEDNPHGVKFSQLHAVDLVDMNGDGLKDIITGKRYWAHGPNGDAEPAAPAVVYWFELKRTNAGVQFQPHLIDDDSGVGTQVIAADVTNDGAVDVIIGNKKGHFVLVAPVKKVAAAPAGPTFFTAALVEPAPNTLSAEEEKAGWKLLFDGKSLAGWRRYKKQDTQGWTVKDGTLFLEGGAGDLMTEAQYANFELTLDFKFAKGNNSGVIYRVTEAGGPSYESGPEMQVMNHQPTDKLGKNSGGSLYDMFAPTSNPFRPADQWNTFKIVANGKHLEQWVNGVKVVDCEIGSDAWNQAYAASKWKKTSLYASQDKGHIALQDHGGQIAFRNVKIKVLP